MTIHLRTPMDRPLVDPVTAPICDHVVAVDPFAEDSHFRGLFVHALGLESDGRTPGGVDRRSGGAAPDRVGPEDFAAVAPTIAFVAASLPLVRALQVAQRCRLSESGEIGDRIGDQLVITKSADGRM